MQSKPSSLSICLSNFYVERPNSSTGLLNMNGGTGAGNNFSHMTHENNY